MEAAERAGQPTGRGDAAALARAAERARPVTLARDQTLPVLGPLEPLFVDGGLQRGSTLAVQGVVVTTLALAMAAGPSASGSWVGAVGLASLGLVAAAEVGLALERLVLVAEPPAEEWATVVATVADGVDVVLVRPPRFAKAGMVRRLQARARDRGAVLVVLGVAPVFEPDVTLTVTSGEWVGLDAGAGHLQARRVVVEATGRRHTARSRRVALWLPDADGTVRSDDAATVTPLRGAPVPDAALRGAG